VNQSLGRLMTSRLLAGIIFLAMCLTTKAQKNIPAINVSISDPQQGVSARKETVKISIRVNGRTVSATVLDNLTARDFVSLLPLNLSLNDLFGREKYGSLPRELSEKAPTTRRYDVGDIGYWSPGHDVAIYYYKDGELIPSPGIIPIAKIDSDAEVFNTPGSVNVAIEVAR